MPADVQTTNSATSTKEEREIDQPNGRHENHLLQQRWHGWGSPVGLGVGLVCVGGFFVLLALGLFILSSIG